MSTKPDINYLSVTAPGQVIENQAIMAPPADPGSYWSDLVHVNVPNVTIRNCILDARNCEENAVDGNRAHNLRVENCTIYAGQQVALYVKGLHGAVFEGCLLLVSGGHSDGYAGDYSDQSSEKTTAVVFGSCVRTDGKPFRIAWAHADKPRCVNMKVHYQYLLSFVRRCYVNLKYLLK